MNAHTALTRKDIPAHIDPAHVVDFDAFNDVRFKQAATPKVSESALGNWKNVDRGSIHSVNREEVDRILDKISASGLASLTPQERQFLSNFVPPDDRKPIS